mgnify:FL=1
MNVSSYELRLESTGVDRTVGSGLSSTSSVAVPSMCMVSAGPSGPAGNGKILQFSSSNAADSASGGPPKWSVVEWLGFEPDRLWPLACVPAIAGIIAVSFAICYNGIYHNNRSAFRHHDVVVPRSSSLVVPSDSGNDPADAQGVLLGPSAPSHLESVSADTLRLRDFLYYSYCMLVPGPPGDIAPNTTVVRLISVTESMCGVILLVVLVAILGARRRV